MNLRGSGSPVLLAASVLFAGGRSLACTLGPSGAAPVTLPARGRVSEVLFARDGRRLILSTVFGEAYVVNVRAPRRRVRLAGRVIALFGLARGAGAVLGVDRERRATLWSLRTGKIVARAASGGAPISFGVYHSPSRRYYLLTTSGVLYAAASIRAWGLGRGQRVRSGIEAVAAAPGQGRLAALTTDERLLLLDLPGFRLRWSRPVPGGGRPLFLDRGRIVLVDSILGRTAFRAESGDKLEQLSAPRVSGDLTSPVSASADGRVLTDGTRVWRAPRWMPRPLQPPPGRESPEFVCLSPSGRLLAAWSERGSGVQLYSLRADP